MRVKSLAAAVGLSVITAVALGQGVSSANRGSTNPVVQPQIETPADPVDEAPAPSPEVTPTAPAVEETPVPPVVEEPPTPPVTTTTTISPVPATPPTTVAKPITPTVVAPAPVVTLEKKAAPAPEQATPDAAPNQADPCHMDSYQRTSVASLQRGEAARANKVDRNGNGWVCRKDIPGKGKGNTGQNSNIKDDQVR
jgi:outer membrane biosynthesis protein TonB